MNDKELQHIQEKVGYCKEFKGSTIVLKLEEAELLLSTIEGLKVDVRYWHDTWMQERDLAKGQKENLRQQVEGLKGEVKRLNLILNQANDAGRKMAITHVEKETELLKVTNDIVDKLRDEVEKYRNLREPVQWFAEQMELTLKRNDHKGGWQDCSMDWLIDRLYQEAKMLWIQVVRSDPVEEKIIKESTDVANIAMMIADNARRKINNT